MWFIGHSTRICMVKCTEHTARTVFATVRVRLLCDSIFLHRRSNNSKRRFGGSKLLLRKAKGAYLRYI